jgi:hypothetical protein
VVATSSAVVAALGWASASWRAQVVVPLMPLNLADSAERVCRSARFSAISASAIQTVFHRSVWFVVIAMSSAVVATLGLANASGRAQT